MPTPYWIEPFGWMNSPVSELTMRYPAVWNAGAHTIQTGSPPFAGVRYLRFRGSGDGNVFGFQTPTWTPNTGETWQSIRFARGTASDENNGNEAFALTLDFYNAVGIQGRVSFRGNGSVDIRNSAAVIVANKTGATVLSEWNSWQIGIYPHATTGWIKIRKNGSLSTYFEALNINTLSSGGGINSVRLRSMGNWSAEGIYDVADWYVGDVPPGDVRSIYRNSNAAGAFSDFALTGAANAWAALAVGPWDGDTGYLQSDTVGHRVLLNFEDLGFTPPTIHGLQPVLIARKTDAGPRDLGLDLRSGATDVLFDSNDTMGSSWTMLGGMKLPLGLDPNTAAAWTPAGINALQSGQRIIA